MGRMRSLVVIERGNGGGSVEVLVMFCGSAQPIFVLGVSLNMCKLRKLLGDGYNFFKSLHSLREHHFC